MLLTVRRRFEAAHYLKNYPGPCSEIHGHSWGVVVHFKVRDPPVGGYYESVTIDFKELKKAVDDVMPDHKLLNGLLPFNPTAENLAVYLYRELRSRGWSVFKVGVFESPGIGALYDGRDAWTETDYTVGFIAPSD